MNTVEITEQERALIRVCLELGKQCAPDHFGFRIDELSKKLIA